MQRTLRALLDETIRRGASDLHIGAGMPPMLRVDGLLVPVEEAAAPMSPEEVEPALREVLSPEQYEKFNMTGSLDFGFFHSCHSFHSFHSSHLRSHSGPEPCNPDRPDRFRGTCYRELRGVSAAFRFIPSRIRPLEELGLPVVLKDIAQKRHGLFLVTGPAGQGKSTTLAALVNEINRTRRGHVITIEDPIEYVYRPELCVIHQREVGTHAAGFPEALRQALRQDPDVILIGELRDLETIAAAVTAAETGHLVLGTLHTQGAARAIDRLVDVFPPHQQGQVRVQLASVLLGICAQQLVPARQAGRVCATELLIATPAMRSCIHDGRTHQIRSLIQTGASYGMHTMEQSLAALVREKIIDDGTAALYAFEAGDLQKPDEKNLKY